MQTLREKVVIVLVVVVIRIRVGYEPDVRIDGSSQDSSRASGVKDQKNAGNTGVIEDYLMDDKKLVKVRRFCTS